MSLVGRFMTLEEAGRLMGRFGHAIPVRLMAADPTSINGQVQAQVAESHAAMECFMGLGNHPSVKLYGWRFCYDHGWMPV